MATDSGIDQELRDRVEKLAVSQNRSPRGVMRDAILQYVDREEARQEFSAEAAAAWSRYRHDGIHLSGDEVGAWLSTWGTDDEAGAPECHV